MAGNRDPGGAGGRGAPTRWAGAEFKPRVGWGEGMSHSRGGRAGLLGAVGHGRSRPNLERRGVTE